MPDPTVRRARGYLPAVDTGWAGRRPICVPDEEVPSSCSCEAMQPAQSCAVHQDGSDPSSGELLAVASYLLVRVAVQSARTQPIRLVRVGAVLAKHVRDHAVPASVDLLSALQRACRRLAA